jgi:hypothetical protein
MTWIQATTLAVAVTGAVLGIVNTCMQISKHRVRLRVVPMPAIVRGNFVLKRTDGPEFPPSAAIQLCVEVVNLSAFPVTVDEIGLGPDRKHKYRHVIEPTEPCGDRLPKRLEPRAAMTVYAQPGLCLDPRIVWKPRAYAKTACGRVFYGSSPAFKQCVAQMCAEEPNK